jgi:V8-like Glu-specific endopeptidase
MRILGLILVFFVVLVSSNCKTTNSSGLKRVIGTNDLKPVANASEMKKHGLLATGSRVCNAFLISNSSVMTALHCLNSDPHAFVGFTFKSLNGQESKVTDILFLDDRKDVIVYSLSEKYSDFYQLD